MPKVFETLGLDADDLAVLENRLPSPLAHLVFRLTSADDATKAYDAVVDLFKESSRLLLVIAWALAAQREVALPAGVAADIRERWVRGKRRDLTERQRSEAFDRIVDAVLVHAPKDAAARALRAAFPPFHEDAGRRALSAARTDDGHGTTPPDAEVMADLRELGPAVVGFLEQWKRLTGRDGGALVLGIAEGRTTTDLVGNPRRGTSDLPSPCDGPIVRIAGEVIRLAPLVRSAGSGDGLHLYVAQGRNDSRTGRLVQVWPTGKGEVGDAELFTWVQAQCREVTRVIGEPKAHRLLAQHFRAWGKGEKSRPLVVIGSAGTGKSLLIQDALRHEVPKAQVLRISGELVGRDVERLVVEVLGRLSGGEDLAWDGRVAGWLEREAERLGHMRGKRLATWLQEGGTRRPEVTSSPPRAALDATVVEVPISSQVFDPVEALWDFLVAFGGDGGASKLVVWVEDAQGCGPSSSVVDQLVNNTGFRPAGPLLVAEYRTLGPDDARETRKRHKRQCEVVECVDLDESETLDFTASLLGVQPPEARKAAKWLYKQASGNPKYVRELVIWLQDRGLLVVPMGSSDEDQRLIEFKPPDRATVPENLKAMARARIDAATRSTTARAVIVFVAAAGHRWVDVELLQKLFGDEARDEVTRLVDKVGLLKEPDEFKDRPWAVRLEHLVARESALELLEDLPDEEAEDLARRCTTFLENFEALPDSGRGRSMVLWALDRIATRAGDGEALAAALTRSPDHIDKADKEQLEAWLRLLRRTTTTRGRVAHDYVLALRRTAETSNDDEQVTRLLAAVVEHSLKLDADGDQKTRVLHVQLPFSAAAKLVVAASSRAPVALRQIADRIDKLVGEIEDPEGRASVAAFVALSFDLVLRVNGAQLDQLVPVRGGLPTNPIVALALLVEIDDTVLRDASDLRTWAGTRLDALELERGLATAAIGTAVAKSSGPEASLALRSVSRLGTAVMRAAYSGDTSPDEIRSAWAFVAGCLQHSFAAASLLPDVERQAGALLAGSALRHAEAMVRRGFPDDALEALELVVAPTTREAAHARLLSIWARHLGRRTDHVPDEVVAALKEASDDVDIGLLAVAVDTIAAHCPDPAAHIRNLLDLHFERVAQARSLERAIDVVLDAARENVDVEPFLSTLRRVSTSARERLEVDLATWKIRAGTAGDVDTARRLFGEISSVLEEREAELASSAMRGLRDRIVRQLSDIVLRLPSELREDRPTRVLRRLNELDPTTPGRRPGWWWEHRWRHLTLDGRVERARNEMREQLEAGDGPIPRWVVLELLSESHFPRGPLLCRPGPTGAGDLEAAWRYAVEALKEHTGGSVALIKDVAWMGVLRGQTFQEEGFDLLDREITTAAAVGNPRAQAEMRYFRVSILAMAGLLLRAHSEAEVLQAWLRATPLPSREILVTSLAHDSAFLDMALHYNDHVRLRQAIECFRQEALTRSSEPDLARFNLLVAEALLDGSEEPQVAELRRLVRHGDSRSDSPGLLGVPELDGSTSRLDVVSDLTLREAAAATLLHHARRRGHGQLEAEAREIFARPTTRRHDVGPMPYARFVTERLGLPLPPMK